MTEPKEPSKEVYAGEVNYVKSLATHSDAFDQMFNAIPSDRTDLQEALKGVYHVEPGRITDPTKMAQLKSSNQPLYNELRDFILEFTGKESHKAWLNEVKGKRVKEISGSKQMVGFESIPLGGLVVSGVKVDWDNIKQHIIPLEASTDPMDKEAESAGRQLRVNIRPFLNSKDAYYVLVKDEAMGGKGSWALSVINPRDLLQSEENLKGEMDASYFVEQNMLGSSTRAALLAKTGKTSLD